MYSRFPWRQPHCVGVILLAMMPLAPAAAADNVYKSIDAAGNVTYSASPEAGAVQSESLELAPPPTESQHQEAKRLEQQLRQTSERTTADLERRRESRAGSVKDAQARLQTARAQLEQARIQRDDDWQNLAQGGRHLKESYFARVNAAEEAVKNAEAELARARRDVR